MDLERFFLETVRQAAGEAEAPTGADSAGGLAAYLEKTEAEPTEPA
jgi:hypothetical protein